MPLGLCSLIMGSRISVTIHTSFGPSQVKPGGRWCSLCLWIMAQGRKEYASDTMTNCPPRLTPGLPVIPATNPDPYSPYPMNPHVDLSPHKSRSAVLVTVFVFCTRTSKILLNL